jgi:hypothetical protein
LRSVGGVADLAASASALAVLGAELHARVSGEPIHPSVHPHVEAILREPGASNAMEGIAPEELRPLVTEIRHFWLLDGEFLSNPERPPGWTYTDNEVLATGGELTEGFADVLPRIVPKFDDLAARLGGSDGRVLDIGTGVGRLSIAMARRWPSLHVVGIDTWAPSLALGRANVAAAGLQDRIELREQSGEDTACNGRRFALRAPAPRLSPPPKNLRHVPDHEAGLAGGLSGAMGAKRHSSWPTLGLSCHGEPRERQSSKKGGCKEIPPALSCKCAGEKKNGDQTVSSAQHSPFNRAEWGPLIVLKDTGTKKKSEAGLD